MQKKVVCRPPKNFQKNITKNNDDDGNDDNDDDDDDNDEETMMIIMLLASYSSHRHRLGRARARCVEIPSSIFTSKKC